MRANKYLFGLPKRIAEANDKHYSKMFINCVGYTPTETAQNKADKRKRHGNMYMRSSGLRIS